MKIVAIHGNAQNQDIWNKMDEQFSQRVQTINLLGHGGNNTSTTYSMKSHAKFVADKITEDSILIGHSLGGHISLRAAQLNNKIKKLILIATPPLKGVASMTEAFLPGTGAESLFSEEVDEENLGMFFQNAQLNPDPDLLKLAFKEQDPKHRSELLNDMLSAYEDETKILESLGIPIVFVIGDKDGLINRDYLENLTPNLKIIPNAGHNIMQDNPKELSQFIFKQIDYTN